ncbi:hypothetical protein TNCV_4428841 [Trichonephila clavipes]|nr:hypothetical protein TNCV_4428841 [Trichonephila clavipes]
MPRSSNKQRDKFAGIKRDATWWSSDADCGAVGPFEYRRRHGDTLNSRMSSREVGGRERQEASDHCQDVLSQNWGGTEKNRTVTCMMVLKVTANDRRTTSP